VLQLNNQEAMHGHKCLLIVFKGNRCITVISILVIIVADLTSRFFNIFTITMEQHVMIVDKCSLGFLDFVSGTASLAERLGISTTLRYQTAQPVYKH